MRGLELDISGTLSYDLLVVLLHGKKVEYG
jgi:hypothetical protein